ncbi:MAG: hypothetical protein V4527_02295 [Pseudomonadota bacterium]
MPSLPAHGTAGNSFSPAMIRATWSLLVEWLVNIAYGAGLFRCRTRTLAALAIASWLVMAVAGYFTGKGWCVGMKGYHFITYGILRGTPHAWRAWCSAACTPADGSRGFPPSRPRSC